MQIYYRRSDTSLFRNTNCITGLTVAMPAEIKLTIITTPKISSGNENERGISVIIDLWAVIDHPTTTPIIV